MKINQKSSWLFLYKYAKEGELPRDLCQLFWDSFGGLVLALISLPSAIHSMVTKEYEYLYITIYAIVQWSMVIFTFIIYSGNEISILMSAIISLGILVVLGLIVAIILGTATAIEVARDNVGGSIIVQTYRDFKNKHCTLITIENTKEKL